LERIVALINTQPVASEEYRQSDIQEDAGAGAAVSA
jgi:hypothetical protein